MARVQHPSEVVQTNEAVPELLPEISHTKKTVELCGHERERMRCTRTKGHDGPHESLSLDGPERW